MSLALLRVAAEVFAPAFQDSMGWLLAPDNVRGLHISFDEYWFTSMLLGGPGPRFVHDDYPFWPGPWSWRFWNVPPLGSNHRREFMKDFRDFAKDVQNWIHYLPEGEWRLRCRSMGYAPNSLPIVFRVI